ncbi:MAG: hypothetical protein NBKEAIPA_03493 [Nitrospirae bacterium]|nr:hypothetical protein [Nitrospirota bacterium]
MVGFASPFVKHRFIVRFFQPFLTEKILAC